MFNFSPSPIQKQTAVIIPIQSLAHTKRQLNPCIFCGETMKVRKFRGKTVCLNCLRQIPAIFSYG